MGSNEATNRAVMMVLTPGMNYQPPRFVDHARSCAGCGACDYDRQGRCLYCRRQAPEVPRPTSPGPPTTASKNVGLMPEHPDEYRIRIMG